MSEPLPPPTPKDGPGVAVTPSGSEAAINLPSDRGRSLDKIPRNFGRYRILDRIGKGGMGAVFRAHDTQLDRTVALKVPFLGDDDAEMRQRFLREARSAAALHHPNICPVFDVGEIGGVPYLTMAFIEGRSLATAIESGPLSPSQAALLVRKVALAMQEAHNRGIIHRDLKPGNILQRPNGEPVVMDFGLARRADDRRSEGLTRKGDILGTLEYMPPEQLDGDNAILGPAADIYALGVVLYESLTGQRPFSGNTVTMLTAILLKPPTPPSELRPEVPVRLEEICLKAMARQPADRYQTMAQFAAALTEFLRSPQPAVTPVVATPVVAAQTPTPGSTRPIKGDVSVKAPERTTTPAPATEKDPSAPAVAPPAPRSSAKRTRSSAKRKKEKPRKESYRPYVLGGIAGAALCIAGAVLLFAGGDGKDPAETRSTESDQPPAPVVVQVPVEKEKQKTTSTAKKGSTESKSTQPTKKSETRPTLAVTSQPNILALAVGERRNVTVKIDRRNYQDPVTVRWSGPKEVRISPAGPITVRSGDPDPVLSVRLIGEPTGASPRLEITAVPSKGAAADTATARVAVQVIAGPCVRVIEVGNLPEANLDAIAFTPDASLALLGGGPERREPKAKEKSPEKAQTGEERFAIRVWDLSRGEAVGTLPGHTGRVTYLAVTADGKNALSVSTDETVIRWDLARGSRETQSPRQPVRMVTAAMSPDARRGLVVYPASIMKVDLERFSATGQPIKAAPLTGTNIDDSIRTAAVSGKRQGLVGGLDGKLFLIEWNEKIKPKPLVGHREAVLCSVFSPSGDLAATGGGGVLKVGALQAGQENIVCLWDVGGAALKWKGDGHAWPVVCVAFSPDGRFLASGSSDGEVRVWAVEDGRLVTTLKGHTGRILGLAFAADGKLLWSGATDRTLRQWRLP
jgi:serine/threonine protein kinase